MDGLQYIRFENEMRGSRQIVRDRLEIYLPIISSIQMLRNGSTFAIDLGSGRGEWLELLIEAGWHAKGIDSNPAMVNFCQDRGLNVEESDIFDFLSKLEVESVDVISAFQVVEHLNHSELVVLLDGCLRALKPGGIMIMETPNPQNLLVGCSEFYVDPTHQRPLPPRLLKYLAVNAGFINTKILYLNGSKDTINEMPQLRNVIVGTGFDYAVLAQKAANEVVMEKFNIMTQKCTGWAEDMSLEKKLLEFDVKMREIYIKSQQLDAMQKSLIWRVFSVIERFSSLLGKILGLK